MDKEDIESMMQKITHESQDFIEAPTYMKALEVDKDISILRYLIGEQNFINLHYFRMVHEKAVELIDKHITSEKKK